MSDEDKQPYLEQCKEDKERVAKLIQDDPDLLELQAEKKAGKKGSAKVSKPEKKLSVATSRQVLGKPVKKAVKKLAKKQSPAVAEGDSADAEETANPDAGCEDEPCKVSTFP